MASVSVKRKRRRRHADEDGDPEFQVAPMVDVLLVLMLFFMSITSTELLKKQKNLTLAEAQNAKQDADKKNKPNELVVNVSWSSDRSVAAFSMDGVDYPSANSLQNVLASKFKENPHAYVLIRADKDVEYSNIADLMTACGGAGISSVTFAVIVGGGKNQAAPKGTD